MFNLAEILTLVIGCLLALVFIDGVRRAIRIRRSKLKVDLINPSSEELIRREKILPLIQHKSNKSGGDASSHRSTEADRPSLVQKCRMTQPGQKLVIRINT